MSKKKIPVKKLDIVPSEKTISMEDIKRVRKDTDRFTVIYLEDSLCVVGKGKMVVLGIPTNTLSEDGVQLVSSIVDDALQAIQYEIYKEEHPRGKKTLKQFFNN